MEYLRRERRECGNVLYSVQVGTIDAYTRGTDLI